MRWVSLGALCAIAACAVAPTAPGVAALPGTGKTLEQFQMDDSECQRYAGKQVAQPPGAVASSMYDSQRRYDFAYIQCMYSKGHKVPVSGAYTGAPAGSIPPPSQAAPSAPEQGAASAPK
jgi:hypothetical protein